MSVFFSLILALSLDYLFGEPKKYHPLVGFGNIVTWLEKIANQAKHTPMTTKILGICSWCTLVIPSTGLAYLCTQIPWLNLILAPIILYFCIAPNSLIKHAQEIYQPLNQNNIPQARCQLAKIVSRNTHQLQSLEIRRATIESVLENGADAVFAPIFWFLIAGIPGVIIYRLSNTLDAMWGYKNPRYLHFGWAAAKIDDVLNWLPARLTAISYALCGNTKLALTCWHQQAKFLESPNASVVMTAGAGALNLTLGGNAIYDGKLKAKIIFGQGSIPTNQDILRANGMILHTLILWLSLLFIGNLYA